QRHRLAFAPIWKRGGRTKWLAPADKGPLATSRGARIYVPSVRVDLSGRGALVRAKVAWLAYFPLSFTALSFTVVSLSSGDVSSTRFLNCTSCGSLLECNC